MTRRITLALAAVALMATTACGSDSLEVTNSNSPTPEQTESNPLIAAQFYANGILASDRDVYDDFIIGVGNFGRESFNVFPTDGRTVTGWYRNFNNNTSFSAVLWTPYLVNVRNTRALLRVVEGSSLFTAGDRTGTRGFTETERGINLGYLALTRNQFGVPVQQVESPDSIYPFVSRDSAFRAVSAALDAGYTALTASGATFPFSFPGAQFSGFTSPTTYAQYNRAMAARILVVRATLTPASATALYGQALTAITQSFITPTLSAANRSNGPNHIFSTTAGDTPNGLFEQPGAQGYYVNPDILARFGSDSLTDNRFAYLRNAPTVTPNSSNVTTSKKIVRFPFQTSPVPAITNEELYLLRAEARYFTGDVANALSDINAVRAAAGLPARGAFASAGDFRDELLRQKTRSLLGLGLRWIDYRRFGRLDSLPNSGTTFRKTANQVIPQQECVVRSQRGNPALLCPVFTSRDPENGTI